MSTSHTNPPLEQGQHIDPTHEEPIKDRTIEILKSIDKYISDNSGMPARDYIKGGFSHIDNLVANLTPQQLQLIHDRLLNAMEKKPKRLNHITRFRLNALLYP